MAQPSQGDVEQAMVLLDTYNRQLEAIGRQMQLLQTVLEETVQARAALEGLRKEPAKEILVPLGANTYIHAQAAKRDVVITGIGAQLSTEKPWDEAEKRLADRSTELQAELQRMSDAAMQLQSEASRLQAEIEDEMARIEGTR